LGCALEFDQWKTRLITSKYVYLWVVRLGEDKKLSLLVIVGVTLEGKKRLIAVEPGYCESENLGRALLNISGGYLITLKFSDFFAD
jgi:transposase-like protein